MATLVRNDRLGKYFKKSRNKEGHVKAHVVPNLLMSEHFGLEENLFVGIWL